MTKLAAAGKLDCTAYDTIMEGNNVGEGEIPDSIKADILGASGRPDSVISLWSTIVTPGACPSDTLKYAYAPAFTLPEIAAKTIAYSDDESDADYRILGKLGEGGMGVVFEAGQKHLSRRVALKMIKADRANDPLARNSFFYEAVITAGLEHPGIIPVLEFGISQDKRVFYVMKKASGVPWHRVIHKKTRAENLDILYRIADVMAYTHAQGVIHRDLKPANILLGEFGEVWVGDWGVALRCNAAGNYTHAHPGGTPQYMPPEMARCDAARIGPRSDVYLLGAILFEIVTGQPPHVADSALTALDAAAANTAFRTDNTDSLLEVAYKAMAQSPGDRYDNASEFREAIKQCVALDMSRELLANAKALVEEARETCDYATFQKAVTLYDAALVEHPDSTEAGNGRLEALLAYARTALSRSEYDLALSLISPLTSLDDRAAALADVIERQQAEIVIRRKRHRFYWMAMIGVCLVGVALFTAFYHRTRQNVESVSRSVGIHDAFMAKQIRTAHLMRIRMSLPGGGNYIVVSLIDSFPRFAPLQFEKMNETREEREAREQELADFNEREKIIVKRKQNCDEMMARLKEMFEPVEIMMRKRESYFTESDANMTEFHQILKSMEPQIREEITTAKQMGLTGELESKVADTIVANLTRIVELPDFYRLPEEKW